MSNFNQEAYDRATGRRDLARTDLEELAQQVEDGELDEETAAELRSGYEAELATAEAALAGIGSPPAVKKPKPAAEATKKAPSEKGQPEPKTSTINTRLLVGAGILIAALVVILISVQNSSEPDQTATGPIPGAGDGTDPCAELEAALSEHSDDQFRLALADCYSGTGNAMSAIEFYRGVADDTAAAPADTARANVGLGLLNLQIGELQTTADYMNTALEEDANNVEAKYYLGMLLIYDLGDPEGGAEYLQSVLEGGNLPETVVLDIEAALAFVEDGGTGS